MIIRTLTALALGLSLSATPAIAAEETSSSTPGQVWWNEYLSSDPATTSSFYANVVGWQVKTVALDDPSRPAKPGEKPYLMMMSGTNEQAGLMQLSDVGYAGARAGWFTYFFVENLEAALDRAIHRGGKIVREPVEISDDTRIAVIADPEGVLVGLAARNN
jgi:predicted enzyme related to lactoylglutathione lyase